MSKPIIYANNVDVTYNKGKSNEFKALKGANIEIQKREYIILFGPSGCGKSTLLYSIFGVLEPSAGEIIVKGDSIYKYTSLEMVYFQRKTMGIMYQSFNLIPSITVLDNVSLPLIFAGLPADKREKRAMELLERFGVAQVAHKRPTLLSGGQQQRVSVARSLVNDPEILIADEPVGNLDSISAKAVMDTLDRINERDRKTIILVTHDAKHLPYAHRVFYLKDGNVERIVANPEKRQVKKVKPGETIVTEIEQIARIYPYDSPSALRVKSVVNYVTQDLSFDQIVRLEKITEGIIEGRLNKKQFMDILMAPSRYNGVGLQKPQAEAIADKMLRILKQSQDVTRFRRSTKGHALDLQQDEYVDHLVDNMIGEYSINADQLQRERLKESVRSRVSGYIKKEDLKKQMVLPVEKGGSGFNKYDMHEMARHLEKLIAQGVAFSGGGVETVAGNEITS